MRKIFFSSLVAISLITIFIFEKSLAVDPKNLPKPSFNSKRAFKYLCQQVDFGPRILNSDSHQKAKKFITNELKKSKAQVQMQEFTGYGDKIYECCNILAFYGSTSQAPILLGAHWDTRPWADAEQDKNLWSTPILGANDGASGVAVLLEMAQILSEYPPPMETSILLAFFDAEDAGPSNKQCGLPFCLGSEYFAKNYNGTKPIFGIILDMVGASGANFVKEFNSFLYAQKLQEQIWFLASKLSLNCFKNQFGKPIFDDHIPLIQANIPAVDIVDLDYPYWHTLRDTTDKCHPDSLECVGNLLIELIYSEKIKTFSEIYQEKK